MKTVPKPLVLTNQWFIVLSVLAVWVTGWSWILLLPLIAGLMGLIFHFNPVMKAAKTFLLKPPSAYTQEDFDQQQFNQMIAVVCLAIGLIGYAMHWMILAYVFTTLVFLAAFIAILGFCVGCFIRFQWQQYQYRRKSNRV
ncbi:DUF4395 domain-containing protein [Metabacillus sp. GX 13764]|uniref:DUF4395 domain-containing protein n=1 Tax=Metabacillus kandeliae TaxID=2900151 RepID=UPI001E3FCF75|nr:DUF4395 domain-containing protein [Metabacillus kandeliae]MCD7035720.1 DUF4395 domain-containing protein [Metabacillus kandeliae]